MVLGPRSPSEFLPFVSLPEVHHLGHTFLAKGEAAFQFGALIADGVKGAREKLLPAPIAAGVAFHRQIDWQTDRHPAFRQARALLRPALGRYAGVFVDLWLDATLGENWSALSTSPFPTFIEALQEAIRAYRHYGPPTWEAFFQAATETDLFYRFASYEGMSKHIYDFISRRHLPLSPALVVHTLHACQPQLESLLMAFWQEARHWQPSTPPPSL
jgi:acyl carrier protein phosphodiesterase